HNMPSMYTLPLYFPQGMKVDPIGVMYSLDSYHEGGESDATPTIKEFDPIKQLEKEQGQLIKLLEAFNSRLDKHLSGLNRETASGKKKEDIKQGKATSSGKQKGGRGNVVLLKCTPISTAPWKIQEEKMPAEDKNGLSACAAPTVITLNRPKINKASISVTPDDIFWVESLAKVGSERGVAFSGEVTNGIKAVNGEVVVNKGASFSLSIDTFSSSDRVTAWKMIGAALGVFSFEAELAVQNTHIHRWLMRLDEVIEMKKNDNVVGLLLSSSSQFLSRFDSLSSHCHLSLPDLLIRPLFNSNLPNNVELWVRRIDSAL
ncbi:hypothetical protein PFISCL1PPCAC_15460, partial [Pristionchus fissidentatus]